MSKVLFLSDIALKNPTRGTPIHMARLLHELRSEHELVVCCASVPETLVAVFVPYPREKGIQKLRAMLRIVDEHKPDTIFTIGQVSLLAPVILKLLRDVRIVVELQGVEYIEKYTFGHIGLAHYYFWKYKSMLLLPLYDVVIAFSRRTANLYPLLRDVRIIFPGIDIETVPHVQECAAIPPLIIGYAGNTDAYQGLLHIIEAVALVRSRGTDARMHLVLTGDDTRIAGVRSLIQKHNLQNVATLMRNLSHKEAQNEMLKASVLPIPRTNVLESVYGFPSKLPESLAIGLPVILTNVGATPELMPDIGEHAIVIPAEDITNHLAVALERVAGMSVEERRTWGARARAYAERFNWKHATAVASSAL